MSANSIMTRRQFMDGDIIRDKDKVTPDDVIRYDDIVYGNDGPYEEGYTPEEGDVYEEVTNWQVLDVYRPMDREGEKLPVIMNIHGGAWVYGTKETYQFYCMSLAQRGFAVVNFSYRIAPNFKHPAQLTDINSVAKWVMENADKYGLDVDNVFAVGDSAGGHLLALYAEIVTNKEYAKNYDFNVPAGFKFNAVGLNCGKYHMEYSNGDDLADIFDDLIKDGVTKEKVELISPDRYVTSEFPPSFVMTSENDFLNGQVPYLILKLIQNKVPYVSKMYCGKETKLEHVFHCDIATEDAKRCNDEECDFFKEYIK